MTQTRSLFLGFLLILAGANNAFGGALDVAAPIGRYLDGVLPTKTPTAASGSWEVVNAFPNLTVIDPIMMIPVPGTNQLMIAEKNGRLVVFENDPNTSGRTVLIDFSDRVQIEGDSGLLGVAFHPGFGQAGSPNRDYVYVFYRYTLDTNELNKAYCRLSRFTWESGTDTINPASEFVLINQYDRHNWHNGGGLFFGADDFLYLSIGDEGGVNDAFGVTQKRNGGLFSGVLRIDVDQDPTRSHPIRRNPVDAETPPVGWPGSTTQGYYIPNDNPWLSPDGSQLEEYWAIGVRSPYRMTRDAASGRIWLGDVGQGSKEEVNLIEKGGNYQWAYLEGSEEGPSVKPSPVPGTEFPPVHEYGRSEGGCVIGGYVYRGAANPGLVGKYLFGDYNNGQIRTMDYTPGEEPVIENIVDLGDQSLTSFGIDANGEVYLLTLGHTGLNGGIIYKIQSAGLAAPEPPATLSATGAFTNLSTLTPRSGLMPYELIQPLWSDGADKKRWIAIPNDGAPNTPGEVIAYSENESWIFPIGTVLIKHFEFAGRRLETRFFVRGSDGKYFGFTYKWRPDNSDADLLPGPAVEETIDVGGGETITWHFPGRIECFVCHTDAAGTVLGPKTRHLNKDLTYPLTGRTDNQLMTLSDLGFLSPVTIRSELSTYLTSANINDTTETLDRRARSYFDINCSQCHQPGGPTQASIDARLTTPANFQNIINAEPGNLFGIDNSKIVKPGVVSESILHFRMNTIDGCCAMPPLAKNAVDADAVRVVAEWIESLDPVISPAGATTGPAPADYTIPEVTLTIPGGSEVTGVFTVNLTASEEIRGLTASDFAITNGTISALTGSGMVWSFQVTPASAGPGTILLPPDRITDVNGNANRASAAPLEFTFTEVAPPPGNLLTNGGFENGLSGWIPGGSPRSSTSAFTGSGSAALPANSYLARSVSMISQINYTLSGFYFTTGSPNAAKVGVSFRNAAGEWIGDRSFEISPSVAFTPLQLDFTPPPGAAVALVFVLNEGEGEITFDDLRLAAEGNGDPVGQGISLIENGSFESDFAYWDPINQITISADARSGEKAARIQADSFIVYNAGASPGQNLVLTGSYFSEGNPERLEAGFTFWRANNTDISDSTILLSPSAGYDDFELQVTVPAETDHISVWFWNGPGGVFTIDRIAMVRVNEMNETGNLLPDGGFEGSGLDIWEKGGGPVVLVSGARSGAGAVELGTASFLTHARTVRGGEVYQFGGYYKTSEDDGIHEAGLVFRGQDGSLLGEKTVALEPGSGYLPFSVSAVAPAGAVTVSAWIFNGATGTLTVDDLTLTESQDAGRKSLSGRGEVPFYLSFATIQMRELLGSRDPDSYTDPSKNQVQPDLSIRGDRGGFARNNLYNATGAGQTGKIVSARRSRRTTFAVRYQNDSPSSQDGVALESSRGTRDVRLTFFETSESYRNCTAAVIAGSYESAKIDPAAMLTYEIGVKVKRRAKSSRYQGILSGRSLLNPLRIDAVKLKYR